MVSYSWEGVRAGNPPKCLVLGLSCSVKRSFFLPSCHTLSLSHRGSPRQQYPRSSVHPLHLHLKVPLVHHPAPLFDPLLDQFAPLRQLAFRLPHLHQIHLADFLPPPLADLLPPPPLADLLPPPLHRRLDEVDF